MEPKFKTSFIPKKPIVAQKSSSTKVHGRKRTDFFMLVALIIFLIAILLSGGLFMYKQALGGQINNQVRELEDARDSINSGFLEEATRLSDRLKATDTILDKHLSPTALFVLLEDNTSQNVSFNNFVFADNLNGDISVSSEGRAKTFASVVFQSDKFGETGYMKDVIFSDLQVNDDDTVSFTFEASINPSEFLLYRLKINPEDFMEEESVEDASMEEEVSEDDADESADDESEASDIGGTVEEGSDGPINNPEIN